MADTPTQYTNPSIGHLYVKMTDSAGDNSERPSAMEMLGKLSVTSQFKLSLHLSTQGIGSDGLINHLKSAGLLDTTRDVLTYDFLCSDASLPGLSVNTAQEVGSHQGVIETFPLQKIFPPLDVTFYVDTEFKVIRLFEEWINYINPLYDNAGKSAKPNPKGLPNYNLPNQFFRLRYPDEYKRMISITKFERNFRLKGTNTTRGVPSVTYRMIEAFPTNVNSIPVTYEGSVITKTTVSFVYSRYVMDVYKGFDNDV